MTSEADTQAAFLQALKDRKWEHRTPMMMGLWTDALCLGLLFVVFALWTSGTGTRARDGTWTRALVLYSTTTAVVGTVLINLQMIKYAVEGFGDWAAVAENKYFRLLPAMNALTRVPACFYFGHRAWRLHGRDIWVPLVLTPPVSLYLAESLHATIVLKAFNQPGGRDPSIIAMLISSICEALIDIVNTIALFTGLRRLKTGWKRTDRLLTRVIHWGIETQLPPLLVAIVFLTTLIVTSGGASHAFVFLPKVHIICLLLVVNRRMAIDDKEKGGAQVMISRAPTEIYGLPPSQASEPDSTAYLVSVEGQPTSKEAQFA